MLTSQHSAVIVLFATVGSFLLPMYTRAETIPVVPASSVGKEVSRSYQVEGVNVPVPKLDNIGGAQNAQCVKTGQPCWATYGTIVPIAVQGVCASPGVCKATTVGSIIGATLNVGATLMINQGWSRLLNPQQGRSPTISGGVQTTTSGCQQYYRTSVPTNDPCAVYVPPTGTQTDIDRLINSLRTPTQTVPQTVTTTRQTTPVVPQTVTYTYTQNVTPNVPQTVSNPPRQTSPVPQTTSASPTFTERLRDVSESLFNWRSGSEAAPQSQQRNAPAQTSNFIQTTQEGRRGNIRLSGPSITVEAGFRDAAANVDTAAFFGTSVRSVSPSPAERMCLVRPWQNPIVASYVLPSYFDGVCAARGYRTGVSAAVSAAVPTTAKPTSTTAAVRATTTVPYVVPSIDIWAVPASVSVGSRTAIYWYGKGVESCTVTSPDGSFRQTGLSNLNGASTVPLTGATTFSLSCMTSAGTPVTDYVTVTIGM